MPILGMYDHLNEKDPPVAKETMADFVTRVRKMNYGEHRFLSELVRQREASEEDKLHPQRRQHTAMLRNLLDCEGYF